MVEMYGTEKGARREETFRLMKWRCVDLYRRKDGEKIYFAEIRQHTRTKRNRVNAYVPIISICYGIYCEM